ncbi:MAG TPA: hypothetical protein VH478_20635 [Trebonia sp.]|nr:hypothetical protein [Trebonia sp.]
MHFGHHQWIRVEGTVLERRILHPERSAPHAKLFVVRLDPPGQAAVTVELTLHPSDRDYLTIAQPKAGQVRGFLYDPKSGKLQFDLEDPRTNLTAMLRDADARATGLYPEPDGR